MHFYNESAECVLLGDFILLSHELGCFFLRYLFLLFYRYIKIKICQIEIFTSHIHRARGNNLAQALSCSPVALSSDPVPAVGGGEPARGKGVCGESEKVSQFLGMPRKCLLPSEVLQLN